MSRPPLVFDRIADRYDATRGGAARGVRTADDIEPWLLPGTVLEVGVGTGVVATALRDRGYDVTGLDLSPAMLAHAAQRLGPGRLAVGDARRLPVRDASVSTVVFVYALHVVGDIPAAVAEAARVLRPGGRVVAVHGGANDDPTDIFEAVASVAPLRGSRMDVWSTVLDAGSRAGLLPVWQGETPPVPIHETPRAFLDGLRKRIWSWLWDIDEDTWRKHVEPAIARLEALPDPDRPREFGQRHQMSVFAKPGGGDRAAERRLFLDRYRAVNQRRPVPTSSDVPATHRSFVDRLVAATAPGARLLDAGCGTGRYWPQLLAAGRLVVGVDHSATALAQAYTEHPEVPTRQLALQELVDLADEFDGALCVDVLGDVGPEDWPVVLAGLRQVLRPGAPGYLTVELPEPTKAGSALLVPGEVVYNGGYHFHPSREQVLGWLAAAGLTIEAEAEGDGYWHVLVRASAQDG